ncbi:MAG: thrombospondin type 3 repeat-containing protein [Candidatus Paceibacterota bacterium]
MLFVIKDPSMVTSLFKKGNENQTPNQEGLTYRTTTIGELVSKDTDGDGIADWEETLWGTDPTKTETTPGTRDDVTISKLRAEQEASTPGTSDTSQDTENLTQTDQFSRELFSTIVATTQSGAMDQATVDKITDSLAEKVQNVAPKKVFVMSDLKIVNKNDVQAFVTYNTALTAVYQKYKMDYTVLDVLQKFIIDENNVDVTVLKELNPIITNTNKMIDALVKISVPSSVSAIHLSVINSLERLVENLSAIKLFDTDVIVALGGISQYEKNAAKLESDSNNLANAINQKLKN